MKLLEVAGVAWSGHGPIAQVEISLDGGEHWFNAELEPASCVYAVQQWSYRWKPETPGAYSLLSWATDTSGTAQPTSQRWNRLGYGNNGPQVVHVSVE